MKLGAVRPILLSLAFAFALGACTPRLQPPGPGLRAPELTGDRLIARDGTELPLAVWRPDGPVAAAIVALHGFNDYRNAFATVGPALARHGIATYAYDQRGFGASPHRGIWPGDDLLVNDFADAVDLVRAHHPGLPVHGLGESMGGAVIMAALAGAAAPRIDGAILAAPAVWGRRTMPAIQVALLEVAARIMPAIAGRNEGLTYKPSDNIEMLRGLGRDTQVIKETRIDAIYGLVGLMDRALDAAPRLTVPTLILYGSRDDIIRSGPTCMMLHALPAKTPWRLALYSRGYHMVLRDLQAGTVLADVAAWIGAAEAPLPSGAELPAARLSQACPAEPG
ncbi:MAG: alpha/beta fold hydrolase [Alphaproteobacteria bacterium]|nr:alpha/beta fold hydrolase [Alphaproteobacteria bacterium]